mmetsp:Transcript_9136/g.20181  ORF Transcript_9136/g.20181 Transcript_9136/m.20181 type:complete len:153 (-) Transcript_9136:52-510(-)
MSKATEKAAGRALHPLTHLASTDLRRVARDVRRHELQRLTKRIRFLETSASSQRDGDGDEEKGAKTVAADRRNKNFFETSNRDHDGMNINLLQHVESDREGSGTCSTSFDAPCLDGPPSSCPRCTASRTPTSYETHSFPRNFGLFATRWRWR